MRSVDWHDEQAAEPATPRLPRGASVQGLVSCHHDFGMGVYIGERQEYAHVPPDLVRNNGKNDPPPVGTHITATVLGYDERGRLLLSTRLRDLAGMWTYMDQLPPVPQGHSSPLPAVVESFWAESTPHIRRLLLDEAAGRESGSVRFEFDTENVTLDLDAATATVDDALGDLASETVPLTAFLGRAASYGDDKAIGDGLTEQQRHPPTFRVDGAGGAEPTR